MSRLDIHGMVITGSGDLVRILLLNHKVEQVERFSLRSIDKVCCWTYCLVL